MAAAGLALVLTASASPASANELMLAGPHPMLKGNALSLQIVSGDGFGDSFSGRGFNAGYGYMLQGPLWLDLQMTWRASACSLFRPCGSFTGATAELMTGVTWRFRTDIPVVPYVRGAAGLVFLYPDHFRNAMGIGIRAGGGLRYYLYDWLGFGVELGFSYGHASFAEGYTGPSTYRVGDLSAGVEYQFR
jgi:hypothetical protein